MTQLYLIIPAVVILLFFLPVIIELRITFNILTNTGVISVYLYKKLIIYYIYEIKGSQISLKSEENAQEELLDFSGAEIVFFSSLVKEVLDKLRLLFLDIYYNVGLNDAFLTSMACGYINIIALMLYAKIKNEKPTASVGLYDTASYNQEEAVVVLNTNVSISLFDLVYSLILSGILTLKFKNESLVD